MVKSSQDNIKYWKDRDIDWDNDYTSTSDHPHRSAITFMLKSINFHSLWEVGIGGGANLVRIVKDIPGKQLGGCDVSESAVAHCRKLFDNGLFQVESGEDMMMSDKSIDVILTDMTMIYVGPMKIDKYLKEFRRVGRVYLVMCEFHSKNWWKRFTARLMGYNVYDYKARLEKAGYRDIQVQQLPVEFWGKDGCSEYRSIITAKI